ncbi:Phosphotransferase enzyme family protein [Rubritalea squalenifaciens DSM 18772]|uniref:Phosphotransferase enzyme family protein n=1 Tax=Rubritalea squalenifaciens DSM 18772 TaxID=1123071 RepID=A0A1M6DI50_9BACT|nr:phosphotransferase [Rubritalea squalenifaciens]SHI72793.1 Phosphotransferase enzyme family protein [Rubritalea squalenifaciens DSM 18772]
MNSFCKQDREFLKSIEGQGSIVSANKCYGLSRYGNLLLVLPQDRKLSLKTLSLYQPQKTLVKALVVLFTWFVRLGGVRLLKPISLEIRESSPLAHIAGDGQFGFLLGNPTRDARRLICLYEKDGQSLVGKFGVGGRSRDTVVKEIEILQGDVRGLEGVPEILSSQIEDQYAYYAVPWMDGRSPSVKDQGYLLDLLRSWERGIAKVAVRELPFWEELYRMVASNEERAILDGYANLNLRESVIHGDFTPWNVKCLSQGGVAVLDWEFCRPDGVAGLDVAHYLIQPLILVKKMSASEALKAALEWGANEGRDYLHHAGWGGQVQAWLGIYLFYSHYVLKLNHRDLIECWKKERV